MANAHRKNLINTLILSGLCTNTYAQVVLDGSTGSPGNIDATADNIYEITSNLGNINGSNLFHSFSDFSVEQNHTARFSHNGPQNISNVISRVTGNNPSEIYGTIQNTIPGADFYLLNPNGVLFGENASLDMTGSFHASTANYVDFSDGYRMDTMASPNMTFTSAAPSAFGFTTATPGRIDVDGSKLSVNNGETLSLIGGDIALDNGATLKSSDGVVNIASTASSGVVTISEDTIDMAGFSNLGGISLNNTIAASKSTEISTTGGSAGHIVIRGGALSLDDASRIQANSSGIGTNNHSESINITTTGKVTLDNRSSITSNVGTASNTNTNGISIDSDTIELDNGSGIESSTGFRSNASSGNIDLETSKLLLSNASSIKANSWGTGKVGDIGITTTDRVQISDNSKIETQVTTFGIGDGSNITIDTDRLELSNGGRVHTRTEGLGVGGNINIVANELSLSSLALIAADSTSDGDTGNIVITTNDINLNGPATSVDPFGADFTGIGTSKTSELSKNGHILITNSRVMTLVNRAAINSFATGTATGGNIIIDSDTVNILSGSRAGNEAFDTKSNGGNISITARELNVIGLHKELPSSITDGPIFIESLIYSKGSEATFATGDTGDIDIAVDNLNVMDGAKIRSVARFSSGDPGNLSIQADYIVVSGSNKDQVTSFINNGLTEKQAIVVASSSIQKRSTFSPLLSETPRLSDGTMTVKSKSLTLEKGGSLTTETFGAAKSSDLTIVAKDIYLNSGGKITSSSAAGSGRGDAGKISISAEKLSLNGATDMDAETGVFSNIGNLSEKSGPVNITANSVKMSGGAIISSGTAGDGDGGDIYIKSTDYLILDSDSIITTQATPGTNGNAGKVDIQTDLLVLNSSDIVTSADAGNGGDITIDAANLITTADSKINSASTSAVSGDTIFTNESYAVSPLVHFTTETEDVSAKFTAPCSANSDAYSQFFVSRTFSNINSMLVEHVFSTDSVSTLTQNFVGHSTSYSNTHSLAYSPEINAVPRNQFANYYERDCL